MPAPASPRSRQALPLAALALGLSLAAAIPVASSAKTLPDPHRMHRDGRDGDVASLLLAAGSGATVAVQVCDGEVHAATAAGGTNALPLLALGCEDPGDDTAVLAIGSTGGIAAATGGLALTAPAGAAPSLADLAVANAAAGAADGPGMMEAHHAAMHQDGMMGMGMGMGMDMGGMHAAPAADASAGNDGSRGHGRLMGLSHGDGSGRAMREARAGRGGREANGARESAVGGLVSALPSTGAGGAGDTLLALASAIAAAGAAGSGLALRSRARPA